MEKKLEKMAQQLRTQTRRNKILLWGIPSVVLGRSFRRLDPLKSEPVPVQLFSIPAQFSPIPAGSVSPELHRKYPISSWPFPARRTPKTPLSSTKSGWSWMSFGGNQQTKQTVSPPNSPSSSLDLSHITSRLMVMKTPRETPSNTSSRSTADLARKLVDKNYPNSDK
ncbi:unnamed protein product [Adineta ricciae]|uniref:Uncharacterized protein n=1 Tax=Adineta ricciae TaxID=249248 RepID=A0A814H9X7_ADIRI|nr:unnamed protein product [Adineta ricciae]